MTDTPSLPRSIQAQFHEAKPLCRRVPVSVQQEVIPESFCGKSYAQVESLVIPTSCGLKPDGNTAPVKQGGMARKRTDSARPSPLTVRFSETEKEILRTKARVAGCPVGTFVRASALGSDYRPPANPELTSALLDLNRELTAQGNNLNQIARKVNGQQATESQADSLLGLIARSMLRTHRAVRAALSWGKDGEP